MHWRLERAAATARRLPKQWRNLRWKRRLLGFPSDSNGKVRLHIGCGDIASPEFVNVDARPKPHIHLVTKDLFDLRAVPDGAASLVYMCHVLEHVPYALLLRVLREMRRVLMPGGTLRLSVPDFECILDIYAAEKRDPNTIVGPLMGGQDYAFNFHYNVFTQTSLSRALENAGFERVRNWDPQSSEFHDFNDWASMSVTVNGHDYPISLNLEADLPLAFSS